MYMILISIRRGKKARGGMATAKNEDLQFLIGLYESRKLKTVIDRRYPLDRISEAFVFVEEGHKKGNVIIMVHQ